MALTCGYASRSICRADITAVVLEGRSQAEVARAYGVSKGWVSKLVARYRDVGEAAFEPRSRRPKTNPNATPAATVERIIELRQRLVAAGLDAGPDTIAWHLRRQHKLTVSPATIARQLSKAGLVTSEPRKRPKSSYIRFEAAQPNECWQSDFTHYPLADGTDTEILTWLDDCARYALRVTAHVRVTGPVVLASFRASVAIHGIPASTLTDNGMVFTTRFSGGKGGATTSNTNSANCTSPRRTGSPHRSQTQGKVERFLQTLKNWLHAQQPQPTTIGELQTLLDTFTDEYNRRRPHRSLPHQATPATIYTSLPKAAPSGSREADSHDRVRRDRIDDSGVVTLRHAGRLHHIGVGRTHARTHVILLVHDLNIRVVDATTGELLRELTLDPAKDYQPTGKPRR